MAQGSGGLAVGLGALILILGYAWWVVSLPPFSGAATAAVLLTGTAAATVGALRSRPARPDPPAGALVAWGALAAATGVWQLAAYLQHPRSDHPTLSSLADALLDSQPVRAAAFALWVVAASRLARR